jgi:hypothetical protein
MTYKVSLGSNILLTFGVTFAQLGSSQMPDPQKMSEFFFLFTMLKVGEICYTDIGN